MAFVRTTAYWEYSEIVLFDVYTVFGRPWNVHVVRNQFDFSSLQINLYRNQSGRFPDFLTQMQDHIDSAMTLCSVVGRKSSSLNE